MRNIILILSLSLNLIIFAGIGWFGYQGYKAYAGATGAKPTATAATILEVYDINDGGYLARFYVADLAGQKIVLNDFAAAKPTGKVGDTIKVQSRKNEFSGMKSVTYMIVP